MPKPICITYCIVVHIRQKNIDVRVGHMPHFTKRHRYPAIFVGPVAAPAKVHAEAAHDRDAQKHAASNHQAVLPGTTKAAKAPTAFWIVINWSLNENSIVSNLLSCVQISGKAHTRVPK